MDLNCPQILDAGVRNWLPEAVGEYNLPGSVMISPLSPLAFLARSASVYRDRLAVVDGGRRFTYDEFHQRSQRLAAALQGLGVVAGDRVAVLACNGAMPL